MTLWPWWLKKGIEGSPCRPGPKPKLVVTDSPDFSKVDADTPGDIMLTSFSILLPAKGNLEALVAGALAVDSLKPGDRVLIAEACTHHRVEDDIGTVVIPAGCARRLGRTALRLVQRLEMPAELGQYKLIVHCGACMINRKEMLHRIIQAASAGVPVVNYGVLIASLHGILRRPFHLPGRPAPPRRK